MACMKYQLNYRVADVTIEQKFSFFVSFKLLNV